MNREAPLVSIIVRTKDRPILLKKALRSIAAQSYRLVEVILVNDGGCDLDTGALQAILRDIPLHYERLAKNTGRAHAANAGIKRSSGKYIGFLDDDDEFHDDHISVLAGVLENYDYRVAYSDANISFHDFDPEGREITARIRRLFSSKDFSFQELLIDNYIPLICLLFSREVLEEFRGFDERFDIYEDWDLLIRIAAKYPFFHAAGQTAEYNQWSRTLQISQTPEFVELANAAHLKIIKKHKKLFSDQIIRDLVHIRRTLRDKDHHISELGLRVDEQRAYTAGLEKSAREKDEIILRTDSAIREKEGLIAHLEKIINAKDLHSAGLENLVREKEEHLAGVRKTLQERESHIVSLEKTLQERESLVAGLEKRIEEHQSLVAGLEKTIEEHQSLVAGLEKTLQERDVRITGLEDLIKENEALIKNLENAAEEQRTRFVHLEAELRAKLDLISGLEKATGEKDNKIRELDDAVRERSGHIAGIENTLAEKEIIISGIEERLHEQESRMAESSSQVLEHLERIALLQNAVAERDARLGDMDNELANRELRISGLERQVEEKDGYVTRLESMKTNLEHEIREKDTALKRIYGSRGWKGLLFYYRLRDRVLPPHTARREFVKSYAEKIGRMVSPKRDNLTAGAEKGGQDSLLSPVKQKIKKILPPSGKNTAPNPDNPNYIKVMPSDETFVERKKDKVITAEMPECGNGEKGEAKKGAVLVAGIYLADQKNAIRHIVRELDQSACYDVLQRWIALSGDAPSEEVQAVTVMKTGNPQPKFVLLNQLLSAEALEHYDYLLICDDDVILPENFLDNFLLLQQKYDFALAQPARTRNSFTDHPFVEQLEGLKARRTRFVEIGPVVCIRRDAYPVLLPFDENAHMGWGYDFVWPYLIGQAGLRMGIIDATPVEHSMRKPVKNYNYDEANSAMHKYLSMTPHLSKEEAFTILESYT